MSINGLKPREIAIYRQALGVLLSSRESFIRQVKGGVASRFEAIRPGPFGKFDSVAFGKPVLEALVKGGDVQVTEPKPGVIRWTPVLPCEGFITRPTALPSDEPKKEG